MRQHNKEKIARYRQAFPEDTRTDIEVLKAIEHVENNQGIYMQSWIHRQVHINSTEYDETKPVKVLCSKAGTCKKDIQCGGLIPHDSRDCEPCPFDKDAVCVRIKLTNI